MRIKAGTGEGKFILKKIRDLRLSRTLKNSPSLIHYLSGLNVISSESNRKNPINLTDSSRIWPSQHLRTET